MSRFQSAAILAGGKSTRMGFDKQMLEVKGVRLMEQLIAQLKTRFPDVLVASATPQLYNPQEVRVIEDIYPGLGPLGGIHSALVQAESPWVFVVACDMPYVELPYIDYMRQRLVTGEYQACATCREGRLEPFHAFYSSSSLPQLEADLAQGLYSVTRFLKKINTLIIPEEEAAPYVPGWRAFLNLNTPEEYRKFRGELGGAG